MAEDLFDPQITQIDADYERKFKNMKKRYPCRVVGGEVAEDLDRVVETVLRCRR